MSKKDQNSIKPPDYLPEEISKIFSEGAGCLTIGCHNAAAIMFRLCVDLATRPLLPDDSNIELPPPNRKQRRDLGLRLAWLFEKNLLPSNLSELAACIREDANDGAHGGNRSKEDTEDLLDFTVSLLERLITEPAKLEAAGRRRSARRAPPDEK